MIPGEFIIKEGDITLNKGRETASITVINSGDRPIQVGSHIHFFEVNKALKFERETAYGMRLNIAAGTAIRFESGEERTVELCSIGGNRRIFGINNLVNNNLDNNGVKATALERVKEFL